MSAKAATELPITQDQVRARITRALDILTSVTYTPRREVADVRGENKPQQGLVTAVPQPKSQSIGILQIATDINKGDKILDENTNLALNVLRMGLAVGLHLGYEYAKFSNLETMRERNNRKELNNAEIVEFSNKNETMAAITDYVTASYVLWRLADAKPEGLVEIKIDFAGIPEPLALSGQITALSSMLFHFGSYLRGMQSGLEFLKMTQTYFRAVADEIKGRAGSLSFADTFTDNTYRLESTSFRVEGFTWDPQVGVRVVEFKRVSLESIVGNRHAKHEAHRLAERLVCYDVEAQKNPFMEFDAMPLVRIGHGEPGTGKTMLGGAMATLISDYCEALELPFEFNEMPQSLVSTFQGGSGERAEEWMRRFDNPRSIVYGIADDAENNFEDRNRQGVSSGVREIIGVVLRKTEGASAIQRGQWVLDLLTNLASQLDPAILSRASMQFYIGGAMDWKDFLDQDYLWWSKFKSLDPTFVDMQDPADYQYLSAQKDFSGAVTEYATAFEPSNPLVKEVFDAVANRFDPYKEHRFYGFFFEALKQRFPLFTSRDDRNAQRAVSGRIMDFDLEPAWLQNPEHFSRQPYPRKVELLRDRMRNNMKGLTFSQVRLQETVRYCDDRIRVLDMGRDRAVQEIVDRLEIQEIANRRLKEERHSTQ